MKLFLMMSVLSQGVAQLYQHLNLTFREVATRRSFSVVIVFVIAERSILIKES